MLFIFIITVKYFPCVYIFPCVTKKYFPCVSKFFPVSKQNSLCFPCLENVRTKFPVFPVPWPPCQSVVFTFLQKGLTH